MKGKFTDGINRDRRMTDPLCGILFCAFGAFLIGILGWTISQGSIREYFAPVTYFYDNNGLWDLKSRDEAVSDKTFSYCGLGDYADYPWIYFNDLGGNTGNVMDTGMCVEECPEQFSTLENDTFTGSVKGGKKFLDDIGFNTKNVNGTYKSNKFRLLHLCMPDPDDLGATHKDQMDNINDIADHMKSGTAGKRIYDLYLSSDAIYLSMATSFVWSVVCIYFLSIFAEYVAWGMVFIVQIGLIGATVACVGLFTEAAAEDKVYCGIGAVVFAIMSAIFACMLFCGYNQLKTAIDVLDASADFLAKSKRIFLVPTFYMFVQGIFICVFLFSIMAIVSTGDLKPG